MSVSQTALNGLSALMSLGGKPPANDRSNDSVREPFKSAMAQAETEAKPAKAQVQRQDKSGAKQETAVNADTSPAKTKPSNEVVSRDGEHDSAVDSVSAEVDTRDSTQTTVKDENKNEDEGLAYASAQLTPIEDVPTSLLGLNSLVDAGNSPISPLSALMAGTVNTSQLGDVKPYALINLANVELGQPVNMPLDDALMSFGLIGGGTIPVSSPTVLNPLSNGALQSYQFQPRQGQSQSSTQSLEGFAEFSSLMDADTLELKASVTTEQAQKLALTPGQKLAATNLTATLDTLPINPKLALQGERSAISGGAADLTVAASNATSITSTTALSQPASIHKGPMITVPVNQPNWGQAAGEKVLWMVSQKLQSAEIQLDPPELGPLQVKVSVHQDQVSITFISHNAQVREALDQHAIRLREMFESQGLDLVDVDVSDQSFSQNEDRGDQERRAAFGQEGSEADEETQHTVTKVPERLVDDFV